MASNLIFLACVLLVLVAVPSSGLPQKQRSEDLNDVEMVPRAGKPYSGWNPARSRRRFTSTEEPGTGRNDSEAEDFTITGNPAMDTSIISTIGSIATSLIRAIFGGGNREGRSGGGISGFFNTLFCKIFGGLFKASSSGETCSTSVGGAEGDVPAYNLTSEQMRMVEEYKDYLYAY